MPYPTYSVNTIAHGIQEDCLFGVFNKGNAGDGVFVIKYMDIVPSAGFGTGPTPQKVELRMITSITGGIDVPYSKRNLGASDLPSQVKIVRRPDQVTLANGCALRSVLPAPALSDGFGALCGYGKLGQVGKSHGQYFGSFGYGAQATGYSAITIGEGAGVAIVSPSVSPAYPYTLYLSFALKDTATSHVYHVCTHVHPSDLAAARFAVYNGSGSGKTYEIERIEIGDVAKEVAQPFTQNVDAPYVRFARFGSIDSGKILTPVARNLGYPVPSTLDVRRNFVSDNLQVDTLFTSGLSKQELGFPVIASIPVYHRPSLFRKALIGFGAYSDVGVNCLGSDIIGGWNAMHGFVNRVDMGIVIPPGQGFGIIAGNFCYMSEYYIEATIVYIADAPKTQVINSDRFIKVG
jgi:hypothetical protein